MTKEQAIELLMLLSALEFDSQDMLTSFYAIAFEDGRQSVDTPVALAEAYRCGEEAGRQAEREDAERYRFLRGYMASERTDLDDEFVSACSTNEPERLDEFIDLAIRARGDTK